MDPKAESFYSMSPYCSMGGNPVSFSDPNGDEPITLTAILIGAAIGAGTHTAVHLATNNFTFQNWNWGSFIGSTIAGGVGGIVGPALEAAQIGGFYGGAILGSTSGFTQSVVSGTINGNLDAANVLKSTFSGALIGGMIGGIDAAIRGYRFVDGRSTVLQKRYQAAHGTAKTDNPHYDKFTEYDINEVNDLSNGAPRTRTVDINKGFEGDLTVSGRVFRQQSDANFFFDVDGKTVFEAPSGPFKFKIPSSSKRITWGFRGGNTQAAQWSQIGKNMVGVTVTANPFIKIQGLWRGWDGFLIWGR